MGAAETYVKAHPCVGCGYCCMEATCSAGVTELHLSGVWYWDRCPFLVPDADGIRFKCMLASRHEGALAIGRGCSSPLFNTKREETIRRLEAAGLPLLRPNPSAAGPEGESP